MAKAAVTLTLRVKDIERTRLFMWELLMLVDRMRVGANPEAAALEAIVDRYRDGGDDEKGDE